MNIELAAQRKKEEKKNEKAEKEDPKAIEIDVLKEVVPNQNVSPADKNSINLSLPSIAC